LHPHKLTRSGPIESRFATDSFVELAQESADDVPTTGAADLNVALSVDADNGRAVDARFGQIAMVELVVGDDSLQRCARHFDESHRSRFLFVDMPVQPGRCPTGILTHAGKFVSH
jgi:hypothetical protein